LQPVRSSARTPPVRVHVTKAPHRCRNVAWKEVRRGRPRPQSGPQSPRASPRVSS